MTFSVKQIDKGGYYMKRFKKLTAGLMGVVMALGVCGFTALAAEYVAEIGGTKYEDFADALSKAEDGDEIVLLDNVKTDDLGAITKKIEDKDRLVLEKSLTFDLRGYELKITGGTIMVAENKELSFIDSSVSGSRRGGTLLLTGVSGSKTAINPQKNSSLSVENINVECLGSAFYPQGDAASVEIKNSDVKAAVYCVGTNAGSMDNYGVKITIEGSKLTASADGGDNCAVLINVKGTLDIKDSEITGDRQAIIARAGDVTIENTKVTVTGKFAEADDGNDTKYHNSDWKSGNEVPSGAVIVGNQKGTYYDEADVKLENCEIVSKNKNVPAIYTDANDDYDSNLEISGKDSVVTGKVIKKAEQENADIKIYGGNFDDDVREFIDKDSHVMEDEDGNLIIMDENEYEDYLDDQRDSHRHSYSLKEGKTERDDEEEEPVVTPEPEEEEGPFSDVGKDNPNYDAIVEVYEKGWMVGIADGVFAPNGTLTRGMAVTILWNRAGQPEPASVAPFLDVTSDAWYAKAVAWAYENGITSGYGDTYGPDDFLTTEQFTRMNDIANGRTPEVYVGGAPNATRGWVAGMLVME